MDKETNGHENNTSLAEVTRLLIQYNFTRKWPWGHIILQNYGKFIHIECIMKLGKIVFLQLRFTKKILNIQVLASLNFGKNNERK